MVCTERAVTPQQFHGAPAMPALYVHHFDGWSEPHYKKLVTQVESQASAVSLLESREQRCIKAINNAADSIS